MIVIECEVSAEDRAETERVERYWPVNLRVLNRYNDPVANATIRIMNSTGFVSHTAATDQAGIVEPFQLMEYWENETGRFYQSNYTFEVQHDEWMVSTTSYNVSSPLNVTIRAEPNMNKTYKFFVLESDDWLCYSAWELRSVAAKEHLEAQGYEFTTTWNKDSFETSEDIEKLLTVLRKYHVVMTPGIVSDVPDFDAIAANNFTEYVCRDISEGMPAYLMDRTDVLEKHIEGYRQGVWLPQYHGRTHFNTEFWLEHLRNGDQTALDHFYQYVVRANDSKRILSEYGQTYGEVPQFNYSFQQQSMADGLSHFEELFGYRSTVNAGVPNYRGDENTAQALRDNGLVGLRSTMSYWDVNGTRRYVTQDMLESDYGLVVLMPGSVGRGTLDWYYLETYLEDNMTKLYEKVNETFASNEPYIDCTHRLNFVSTIAGTEWRDQHISQMDKFFSWLTKTHPDTVFLTSPELAYIKKYGYSIQRWYNETVVRNYLKVNKTIALDDTHSPTRVSSWKGKVVMIEDVATGTTLRWSSSGDTILFTAEPDHVYKVFLLEKAEIEEISPVGPVTIRVKDDDEITNDDELGQKILPAMDIGTCSHHFSLELESSGSDKSLVQYFITRVTLNGKNMESMDSTGWSVEILDGNQEQRRLWEVTSQEPVLTFIKITCPDVILYWDEFEIVMVGVEISETYGYRTAQASFLVI